VLGLGIDSSARAVAGFTAMNSVTPSWVFGEGLGKPFQTKPALEGVAFVRGLPAGDRGPPVGEFREPREGHFPAGFNRHARWRK